MNISKESEDRTHEGIIGEIKSSRGKSEQSRSSMGAGTGKAQKKKTSLTRHTRKNTKHLRH